MDWKPLASKSLTPDSKWYHPTHKFSACPSCGTFLAPNNNKLESIYSVSVVIVVTFCAMATSLMFDPIWSVLVGGILLVISIIIWLIIKNTVLSNWPRWVTLESVYSNKSVKQTD